MQRNIGRRIRERADTTQATFYTEGSHRALVGPRDAEHATRLGRPSAAFLSAIVGGSRSHPPSQENLPLHRDVRSCPLVEISAINIPPLTEMTEVQKQSIRRMENHFRLTSSEGL
jgi:hypothetical protein